MRRAFIFIGAAALAVAAASCNCGGKPVGSPCKIDGDCASGEVCLRGSCVDGKRVDGGVVLPDGGFVSNDAGRTLGDGGPCTGLQCDIASCPGNDGGTTLTGKVWDPSGQLPLYDVFVYVPNGQVQPFTQGVACGSCGATISGFPVAITLTDYKGEFTLNNVPTPSTGTIPLVVQIGKWRRVTSIPTPTACSSTPVAKVSTTMPTMHDNTGNDIPRIALSTGNADQLECLFTKMNLNAEVSLPGGAGRIQLFQEPDPGGGGAPSLNGANLPPGTNLYDQLGTLEGYDVVMLPCEGGPYNKTGQETQNVVDYTNDGGRVFATHYAYDWLGTGYGAAPFPSTGDWGPENTMPYPKDPILVSINQGFPKGLAFFNWLNNLPITGTGLTNGLFQIHQPRYDLGVVNASAPNYVAPSTAWMFGHYNSDWTNGAAYNWTPHMTFDLPYGQDAGPVMEGGGLITCGRVVYSDFHVSGLNASDYPGECTSTKFNAQEAALVFMLFDLSSCIGANGMPPPICSSVNQGCTNNAACCAGLTCLTPGSLTACDGGTGAGCQCISPIQ